MLTKWTWGQPGWACLSAGASCDAEVGGESGGAGGAEVSGDVAFSLSTQLPAQTHQTLTAAQIAPTL